jgi:hypothetical protein
LTAVRVERRKVNARRGYLIEDHSVLQSMGVAAAFLSALVLAEYLTSPVSRAQYVGSSWLWFVVPLVLFTQCRLWLSAARGDMTDDPILYAAKDRGSWVVMSLIGVLLALASTTPWPSWL